MAIVTIGERFTYHNDVVGWVADEFGISRIEAKELADQFIQVLLQGGGLTPTAPDAAICPSCGSTKANQHLAMCEIGTMPTPRR